MSEIAIKTRGEAAYRDALTRLSPAENPEILRAAYDAIGPRLVAGIQGHMRGPRPQKLDLVSGSLMASVTYSVSGTTLRAGVPDSHFWFDLHEFGSVGGRKQSRRKTLTRGYPARPAVKPGLDEAIASGVLADELVRAWQERVQ